MPLRPTARHLWISAALGLLVAGCATEPPPAAPPTTDHQAIVDTYVEAYLDMFPTRATGAGSAAHDRRFEDYSPESLERWLELNRRTLAALDETDPDALDGALDDALRRDVAAIRSQARGEIFRFETVDVTATRPLFWTGPLANAAVFLLVRDDRPLVDRLDRLSDRLDRLPAYAEQARRAVEAMDGTRVAAEHATMAARQVQATAGFLRDGLPTTADDLPTDQASLAEALRGASARAAAALEPLADALEALTERATGSPRLADGYAESFRVATGIDTPIDQVLADAEADLVERRTETATFCRSIWELVDADAAEPPTDDIEVVRRCFARVAQDHAPDIDAFVEEYRRLAVEAREFVVEHGIMTLPDGLRLHVDRSPSFFAGQAVGGVYAAGPFAPDAPTLLYVPTPPPGTPDEVVAGFFRDFNHHFDVMITPHETIPGHAAQMAVAARLDSPVPALFADGVYVEGWGTYTERLMLDAGWGTPLARVAHLKKQLENIARTIVDIRVHTTDIDRDEVLRFVRDEALQDSQFAANMWTRAITTSPQLTTYWLGYRQIDELHEAYRQQLGDAYEIGRFVDGMVALGPVPISEYHDDLLDSE